MGKIIKVYCEGKRGNYDFEILANTFAGTMVPVMLQPVGGKRGAKSIIQFKETHEVDRSDFYLLFRDRDFDKPVPDLPQLTLSEVYIYFSYRTTIENYLLNTEWFFDFISLENEYKSQFTSIHDVEVLFRKAAFKIKDYQAVRHALGEIRTGASFDTTWTGKSGTLPEEFDLESCYQRASELISSALENTQNWTFKKLQELTEKYLKIFDENFLSRDEYLIWFQGKDFISSIKLLLPGFPFKSYFSYALKRFDYKQYPDLVELRSIIDNQL